MYMNRKHHSWLWLMLKGIDETLSSKLDFVCFKVCVHISPCSCYGDRHDGGRWLPLLSLSLYSFPFLIPGFAPPPLSLSFYLSIPSPPSLVSGEWKTKYNPYYWWLSEGGSWLKVCRLLKERGRNDQCSSFQLGRANPGIKKGKE